MGNVGNVRRVESNDTFKPYDINHTICDNPRNSILSLSTPIEIERMQSIKSVIFNSTGQTIDTKTKENKDTVHSETQIGLSLAASRKFKSSEGKLHIVNEEHPGTDSRSLEVLERDRGPKTPTNKHTTEDIAKSSRKEIIKIKDDIEDGNQHNQILLVKQEENIKIKSIKDLCKSNCSKNTGTSTTRPLDIRGLSINNHDKNDKTQTIQKRTQSRG